MYCAYMNYVYLLVFHYYHNLCTSLSLSLTVHEGNLVGYPGQTDV